jgi:hypothetical protein
MRATKNGESVEGLIEPTMTPEIGIRRRFAFILVCLFEILSNTILTRNS